MYSLRGEVATLLFRESRTKCLGIGCLLIVGKFDIQSGDKYLG